MAGLACRIPLLIACLAALAGGAVFAHSAVAQTAVAPKAPAQVRQVTPSRPLWKDLSAAQQQALTPLAADWDRIDGPRKKKWLELTKRYSSLTPDQQARMQERMRDWAELTPDQRRVARESYSRAKKLEPEQKNAQWEEYQQLSEEQKKKLAQDALTRKRVTNLPPAVQDKNKLVPPSKATLGQPAQPAAAQ